jgi:hypothetical protein
MSDSVATEVAQPVVSTKSNDITETIPERLQRPEVTTNNLKDIIDWLKLGDIVVLTNQNIVHYIFHDCKCTDINSVRTIKIDCQKIPNLLLEDEWNWYINDAGFKQCKCVNNVSKYAYSFKL